MHHGLPRPDRTRGRFRNRLRNKNIILQKPRLEEIGSVGWALRMTTIIELLPCPGVRFIRE
jgi:hypothetical protein